MGLTEEFTTPNTQHGPVKNVGYYKMKMKNWSWYKKGYQKFKGCIKR